VTGVDSNFATAIRTPVILLFSWCPFRDSLRCRYSWSSNKETASGANQVRATVAETGSLERVSAKRLWGVV